MQIVKKVFHARAGAAMESWRNEHTDRHVKGTTDAMLRDHLKGIQTKRTKESGKSFAEIPLKKKNKAAKQQKRKEAKSASQAIVEDVTATNERDS